MKKLLMVLAFGLTLSSVGLARDRVEFYHQARPEVVREYAAPARVVVRRDCDRVVVRREFHRDFRHGWR